MGEGDGVLTGGQVSPKALILLDNPISWHFWQMTSCVGHLQIHERVLYDMT